MSIDATSVMNLRSAVIQRSDALKNAARPEAVPQADFGKLLGSVNVAQNEAGAASAAYERGDTSDIASRDREKISGLPYPPSKALIFAT